MTQLREFIELGGRVLLMILFFFSGVWKVTAYAATANYMASAGLPQALLPAVIFLEIFGTVAIVLGWKTAIIAPLLALYTLAAALLFHLNFADQIQTIMFLEHLSIIGAFLILAANGPGALSLDARKQT